MEKAWLASQLDAGRSFEAIGREVGRHPSTVAYWAKKHGLTSRHAARHAARGEIERWRLEVAIACDLSVREIADGLRSQPATRASLARSITSLETPPGDAAGARRSLPSRSRVSRASPALPGATARHATPGGPAARFRCVRCRSEHVAGVAARSSARWSRGRRPVRALWLRRYVGALQFHHLDPVSKWFALSRRGATRSLAEARAEAAKCVLLCANCHAEVETAARARTDAVRAGGLSCLAHATVRGSSIGRAFDC